MFSPQAHHSLDDDDVEKNTLGFCSFCVEIVGGSNKKQNLKGLAIAFVVISIICLFIAAAILLTSIQRTTPHIELPSITDQDLFNIKIPKPWNGTWISDKYFSYLDVNDSLWIYNCDTLKQELLFKRDVIQQDNIGHGIVSPSARYILMPIFQEKVRPYYTEYQYNIYEKTRMTAPITLSGNRRISISAVLYSNSDSLFAFVHNFDVYVYNISKKISYRVTTDGNRLAVHNGLVEWIYEYEIFNRKVLLFWSPNDSYLAFIKINLTKLPHNHYLKYDLTYDDDQYSIPYPKYGDPLPLIDVFVYHIKSGKIILVPRPLEYGKVKRSDSYVYVYHVVWCGETCLSVVFGNRIQNSSIIQLYDISNDKITFRARFAEETQRSFLLTRFIKPYFSPSSSFAYIIRYDPLYNGKSMQKVFPRVVRIYFNQTYPQINAKSPEDVNADEIIHVSNLGQVYFTGSPQNDSLERQFYRWTHAKGKSTLECLSCNQSCGYANAQFSLGSGSYYILECLGPSVPYSTLHNRKEMLAFINDNAEFKQWANSRSMPVVQYFTVPLDHKNTVGNAMIVLPPKYNPNVTVISYPVIVKMYDGLSDQRVNRKYVVPITEFSQVINDNVSVVIFDAHGSTGQDEGYFKSDYQNWFEQQYEDYIKLAQYLRTNEAKFRGIFTYAPFGLKARGPSAVIAIELLREENKEKEEYVCGFFQSPVNDLTHYHAVFSERINGLKTNAKSSRPLNIRNKSLAIVHGTADEVVHFKHSATLTKAFMESGIQFDFKVYPDADYYFEMDPLLYNDVIRLQRRFFQQCFAERINDRPKIIPPEDND